MLTYQAKWEENVGFKWLTLDTGSTDNTSLNEMVALKFPRVTFPLTDINGGL